MDEPDFESKLEQLMGQDFSEGTDSFRDALLGRCLAVIEAGAKAAASVKAAKGLSGDDGVCLDEEELDMLAAAGDPFATNPSESDFEK